MARIETVVLTDDLDGTPAVGTVRFNLDGTDFQIDLSEANSVRLREDLAQFITHARKVNTRPVTRRTQPAAAVAAKRNPAELSAIRTWAADSELDLPTRGRISAEVQAAFRAAWEEANPELSYTENFA